MESRVVGLGEDKMPVGVDPRDRAESLYEQGRYDSAAIAFTRALNHLGEGQTADSVGLLVQAAAAHSRSGRFSIALHELEMAEQAWRPDLDGAVELRADIFLEFADAYLRNGSFRSALAILRSGNFEGLSRTRRNAVRREYLIGWAYRLSGDYEKALRHLSQALEQAEGLGAGGKGVLDSTDVQSLQVLTLSDSGRYAEALTIAFDVLATRRRALGDDSNRTMAALENLALAEYLNGDYDAARRHWQRAVLHYIRFAEPQAIARGFSNLGLLEWRTGSPLTSIPYLNASLRLRLAMRGLDHPSIHHSLNRVGLALGDYGDIRTAAKAHLLALEIKSRRFGADHPEIAHTLNNLGILVSEEGLLDSARALQTRGLGIRVRRYGWLHADVAASLHNLADLRSKTASSDSAVELLRRAHGILEAVLAPDHPFVADGRNQLAQQYAGMHQYADAVDQLNTVVAVLTPDDSLVRRSGWVVPTQLLDAFKQRAAIYEEMAESEGGHRYLLQAFDDYRSLVRYLGIVRRRYRRRESKLFLAENEAEIIDAAVALSLRLWRQTRSVRFLESALEYSEAGRFGALRDAMMTVNTSSATRATRDSARTSLSEHWSQLGISDPARHDSANTVVGKYLDGLPPIDFGFLLDEQAHGLPTYSDVSSDDTRFTEEALRRDWGDEAVILEYHLSKDSLTTFVFDGTRLHAITSVRGNLDSLVQTLVAAITSRDFADYARSGSELFDRIVAPIQHLLKGEVLVVPNDILLRVPFEALLSKPVDPTGRPDYADLPYWGMRRTIRYAFSLSLTRHLRSRGNFQREKRLLAVAPTFDSQPSMPEVGSTVLRRLPDARREAWDLWRLFNAGRPFALGLKMDRARVVSGAAASEARLRQVDMSQYRYVHFATHAFVDEENIERSGLVLRPNDTHAQYDVLTLAELPGLGMNAELAVLSACDTGRGKLVRGEGILGFTGAFLLAGARSVVVSLWQANDLAARHLMLPFYQGLLSGSSPAQSLQRSKQQMIRGGGPFAHPVYWASFVLIGT